MIWINWQKELVMADMFLRVEASQVTHEIYLWPNGRDFGISLESLKKYPIFNRQILQGSIGVVYHPEYDRFGNLVPGKIPNRYDEFIYFDETSTLHPVHIPPDGHQIPETYP